MKLKHLALAGAATLLAIPADAYAGGLRGSATSMREQHKVAVERDLEFIDDAAQVRELVASGRLDTIASSRDYLLAGVSFPYAIPEVKLFIERLGKQYREANGTRLVVTSLTRPVELQPRNAHQLSVHPAGMAVDFRVPANAKARGWLESALLQLENRGVLDVTRERFPPHYHVAVFPVAYAAYAEKRRAVEVAPVAELPKVEPPAVVAAGAVVQVAPPPDSSPRALVVLLVLVTMSTIGFAALMTRRPAMR